jgi:hypothetical protein
MDKRLLPMISYIIAIIASDVYGYLHRVPVANDKADDDENLTYSIVSCIADVCVRYIHI